MKILAKEDGIPFLGGGECEKELNKSLDRVDNITSTTVVRTCIISSRASGSALSKDIVMSGWNPTNR